MLNTGNEKIFYKEAGMFPLRIGTIKEVKDNENRVGITPYGVSQIMSRGHTVFVESGAGIGAGYSDRDYLKAGAFILDNREDFLDGIDILVKIKEIVPEEYHLLRLMQGKILYTYLHLAGCPKTFTEHLLKNQITAIGYETVEDKNGHFPLLAPMSRIAGMQSVAYAAQFLQKQYGGKGISLGAVMDTRPSETVIIGGGIAGTCAASIALGMGSRVTLFEMEKDRIKKLEKLFSKKRFGKLQNNIEIIHPVEPIYSLRISNADALICAVSISGAHAPCVVGEEHLRLMKKGSVIVDIAIDQGGCTAWSRPTSHSNPIFIREGLVFCCITNIPGQVARQATEDLTSITLPYLIEISEIGIEAMLKKHPYFRKGLNTYKGKITCKNVAVFHNMMDSYESADTLLGLK